MAAPRRRAHALLVLSLCVQGCTVWRPAPEPPRPFLEHDRPSRVRVTTKDGTAAELQEPVLVGDEIRGFDPLCWGSQDQARASCERETPTVSVAVDDVRALEVRRLDPGRTFALTLVTLVLVGAVAAASVGSWVSY